MTHFAPNIQLIVCDLALGLLEGPASDHVLGPADNFCKADLIASNTCVTNSADIVRFLAWMIRELPYVSALYPESRKLR